LAQTRVRVQICGPPTVEIDGERRDHLLPGRQGRILLAYAMLRRREAIGRDEAIAAVWGDTPPRAVDTALAALLSKLRKVLTPAPVNGLRVVLPADAFVDLDAARESIHRSESALVRADWSGAWAAAQTTLFAARRGFLPGEEREWITATRYELDGMRQRALETYAEAALHLAGTELATAERASRELVAIAPFRESGTRLLMRALAARGNGAEALRTYDDLVHRLRDELGVGPGEETRALHSQLLASQ
jgi:DNA-binding SARP family transcriptional activator